jgi:hypothetical protein
MMLSILYIIGALVILYFRGEFAGKRRGLAG